MGHDLPEAITWVSSEAGGFIYLEINRNSLCSNTGIQITIQHNGVVIFKENIEAHIFTKNIEIQANSKLEIISKLFDIPGSDVVCKWLGLADCKVEF